MPEDRKKKRKDWDRSTKKKHRVWDTSRTTSKTDWDRHTTKRRLDWDSSRSDRKDENTPINFNSQWRRHFHAFFHSFSIFSISRCSSR